MELQQITHIEVEINFYKNQATQNFLEIGKRLSEAKQLIPHGEWNKWLKDKVDFSDRTARRLIECYSRFGNRTLATDLTLTKMTELLSLPDELTQSFVDNNNVREMTKLELREAIKREKQANDEIQKLKNELSKKPKEVTVEPWDYEPLKKDLEDKEIALRKSNDRLEEERKRGDKFEKLVEQKEKEIEDLKKAYTSEEKKQVFNKQLSENVIVFLSEMKGFISRMGGLAWISDYINDLSNDEIIKVYQSLDTLDAWSNTVRNNMNAKGK